MCTLHEEELIDVGWDPWEEFDDDLVFLTGGDLASHGMTVDDAWPGDSAQVDIEGKGNLADVLNEELLGALLVVGDLTVVKLSGRQLVGDEAGLSHDGNFVVGPAVHTANCDTIVQETMTRVEGELNRLILAWLQGARDGEDIKHLIDGKHLRLLAGCVLLGFGLILVFHGRLLLFKE